MLNSFQNKTVPRVTGTQFERRVMMYAELMRKKCNCCKQEKELAAFASKRGKPNSRCRKCIGAYMQRHYLENRNREIQKRREWYAKNRKQSIACVKQNYANKKEQIKFQRIFKKYKLTKEAYLQMKEDQNGRCAACKLENSSKDLAVDHCHKTGKVRGLLCDQCNTSLGLLKDSPLRIKALLDFVEKHQK